MRWNLVYIAAVLASALSACDASDDDKFVTCGSAIKMSHLASSSGNKQYFLNSDTHNFSTGSGQQIVTVVPSKQKQSSLWQVREAHDQTPCVAGENIRCGSKIRLTHVSTGRNLHTHQIRSPLSRQQEVSGFGEDGEGDAGDDWIVTCEGNANYWMRSTPFKLQHKDTRGYLSSNSQFQYSQRNCGGNCPILNHLEVAAKSTPDLETRWKVDLGIHLSR